MVAWGSTAGGAAGRDNEGGRIGGEVETGGSVGDLSGTVLAATGGKAGGAIPTGRFCRGVPAGRSSTKRSCRFPADTMSPSCNACSLIGRPFTPNPYQEPESRTK